ncbi:MAG: IclR family transcriptional regulator [Candidatus Nanopelagicales bacterium]
MTQVPAAEKTMQILLALARAAGPMPAAKIAKETGIARSSLYHLLTSMESLGFVVPVEPAGWGLGASAFEVGSAYLRHEPLEHQARPVISRAIKGLRSIAPVVAHLGVLRGSDTLYIAKESSSPNITLVTDIGVRLPAALTASGRAMLAFLPRAQVRALFPNASAFTSRTGKGPQTLPELRTILARECRAGYSSESGFVSPEHSSVASTAFDHLGQPVAAIGLTYRDGTVNDREREELIATVRDSANALTQRIGGHRP